MSDGNETRRDAGLPPALSRHRPGLADRLHDVEGIIATSPGKSPVPASITLPREGRRPLALFVLGAGDGSVVETLRQAMHRERTDTLVVVVEPDRRLLAGSFSSHDWSAILADPRIRFADGEPIDDAIRDALPDAADPLRAIVTGVGLLPGDVARFETLREKILEIGRVANTRFLLEASRQSERRSTPPGAGPPAGDAWRIAGIVDAGSTALRHLATSIGAAARRAGHEVLIRASDIRHDPFAATEDARFALDADPDLLLSFLRPGRSTIPWRHDLATLVVASSNPRLLPFETFDWTDRDLVVAATPGFAACYEKLECDQVIRPLAADLPDLPSPDDDADGSKEARGARTVLVVGNIPGIDAVAPDLPDAVRRVLAGIAEDWVETPGTDVEEMIATTRLDGDDAFQSRIRLALAYDATRRRRIRSAVTLAEAGFDVRIHGEAAWEQAIAGTAAEGRWHGWLPAGDDQTAAFHRAGVVVNVNSFAAPGGLNMRTFEVPAAAGVLVTDDRPAVRDAFDVGAEVLAFERVDELPDIVGGVIESADRRRAIANAGRERIRRDHTWDAWWAWAERELRRRHH
ncbi:MAG: glycosyltransferase family 1 protein [Phycisphaeraceae bacterium]|nr:glycosyltransferase family 1 protein [Phycisphaeraceae bacterium]